MKPRKGSFAFCSLGALGLITTEGKALVRYKDGTEALAYIGIHLTDKIAPIGSLWSSRNPMIVGHIDEFQATYDQNAETQRLMDVWNYFS